MRMRECADSAGVNDVLVLGWGFTKLNMLRCRPFECPQSEGENNVQNVPRLSPGILTASRMRCVRELQARDWDASTRDTVKDIRPVQRRNLPLY